MANLANSSNEIPIMFAACDIRSYSDSEKSIVKFNSQLSSPLQSERSKSSRRMAIAFATELLPRSKPTRKGVEFLRPQKLRRPEFSSYFVGGTEPVSVVDVGISGASGFQTDSPAFRTVPPASP